MSRQNSRSPKRKSSRRKRKSRVPTYSNLKDRQKAAYDRTTNLVTDLRRDKGSYSDLLRKYHLSSRTARKYGGRDLLGTRGKPVRASKADRRVRDLLFPMPTGDVPIRTRSSRDATQLSDYYNDRDKLLGGKLAVAKFEDKWRGVQIAGEEVLTDVRTIFEMEEADVLKMDSLYASMGSER